MLQEKAVSPRLLELINFLMQHAELNNFVLVGGTALALQYGHRESVDANFFGAQPLEDLDLAGILSGFGKVHLLKKSKSIQLFFVDSIKVDFVNYSYSFIHPIVEESGLRLASPEDIAAMKLSAVAGRGSRKDFIDLFVLLNSFSMREMIDFYLKKFPDGSEFLVLKSLLYFEDADLEASPKMFIDTTWQKIKLRIRQEVAGL